MPSKSKSKDIFCQGNKFNKINKYQDDLSWAAGRSLATDYFFQKTGSLPSETFLLNSSTTKNLFGPFL